MRKRGYYKKRDFLPDAAYNRTDIGRFINYMMEDGRKAAAERVVYSALNTIKETTK